MGVVASLERPDALTDLLDMLRPRRRVYCCSEMSAPWAMSLPVDGYARFHFIERGGAWLSVEGAKRVTPLRHNMAYVPFPDRPDRHLSCAVGLDCAGAAPAARAAFQCD